MYRSNTTVLRAYARSRIAAAISLCAILSILISPFSNIAYAATGVPRILNNQGRLMDGSGNLLGGSGTNYCFRFAFYDNPTVGNGTKVWPAASPSTMTVEVKNGIYNVGIGDVNAGGDVLDYNFEDNDAIYLNVEVATRVGATCAPGDGAESFENLSPRQRIYAAGYSINASSLRGYLPYQSASSTQIPVLSDGNLYLGGVNPYINATSSFVLTLQGGGQATGDINFFNAGNRITAAGDATFAGTISAQSATFTAATSSSFTVTGTASTSNLVVSNAFTFGTSTGILKAIAGVVTSTLVNLATDITGVLGIGSGGTGTSTAPGYGQVLLGNALGGYDLVSTTSLGINSAQWGSITGNLADQTDLQNVLDTKLSFSTWYATTTDALDEGLTNRYYQDSRVQTYLDTIAKSYFFASSSADYWKTQNNFFSTSSADYYTLANNFFSTTSADYLLSTYDKGFFFSSTSADAWSITKNFFATSSADYWKTQSDFFSTSSAAYFASAGLAFSTTSSDAWKDVRNFFSTSSAAYFASAGLAFSTTSSDYWETQQTARTADDLSNDSIEALNDVAAMTEAYGDVFTWNGSSWTNVSTSSLGLPTTQTLASYLTLTDWYATTTQDIAEGGSNLYFTNGRVQTYLATVDKGFFFSTTSADVWKGDRDFFSTTSNEYWKSVSNFFSTSSANFYSASNNFFSTTSATYFADASTTIAKTYSSNVFVAPQTFNGGLTISVLNGPLHANNGVVSATTSVGVTYGGTGRTDAPAYGQLLVGNALGGYDLLATTSLGINSGVWGAITGNIADQTDLQNALNQRLALVDWYATTTQDIAEGGTNLYYQDSRVQTYLDTIAKSYFFASTSADYWKTQNNFFSTSSADYYTLANNFFSTTSANYLLSTYDKGFFFSSTSADAWSITKNFFSTSSADYWKTQNNFFSTSSAAYFASVGLSFSTTSNAYWKSVTDFFSTTSAAYFASAGLAFSTTSSDYWKSQNNFFSTTSAQNFTAQGLSFSTTSADAWKAVSSFFSTSSSDYWKAQNNFFSTSSASFFASAGLAFSTTSAEYFVGSSSTIPKTYTANTFTGENTFNGNTTLVNATATTLFATIASSSSLYGAGLSSCTGGNMLTWSGGTFGCAADQVGVSAAFPFTSGVFGATAVNATTTALQLQGGLYASSTVRFGNAGASQFLFDSTTGRLGLGTSSPYAKLSVQAAIDDAPGTLFAIGSTSPTGNRSLFAVESSGLTTFGDAAGTGDATFQFASDANAWVVGYNEADKSFRIASSTNLNTNVALEIDKGGTTILQTLQLPAIANCTQALETNAQGQIVCGTDVTGGGAGGSGVWATTTNDLAQYPTDPSRVVIIGASATSSIGNILEVAGNARVSGIASTTNLVVSSAFTFGSGSGILKAAAGVVSTGLLNLTNEVTEFLGVANGGTGTSTAPTYGQVLLGNALGGYDLVSTSSLGIQSGGGTWGSITGTLSNQTDLQNALDAKLSLVDWYATTTQDIAEGGTNLYYQDSRVQTYLDTIAKSFFFSSTSADYWKMQNNFFSTSSADYYTLANNFFSTSSAAYFASAGLAFSTTSSDYWKSQNNFFSTTSADYWKLTNDFFSTTSSLYFAAAGLAFSTTSSDYWETQQTARTADDLSDNSIEDLNDVAAMTESFGDLISWNGSSWTNIATSSLALNIADTIGTLLANRGGTGQTSYVEGDILYASDANTLTRLAVGSPGTVLKVSGGGVPVWGTDLTVGGGGGGGAWSTTSTDLLLYPTDTTDVIVVGTNATSTDSSIFEVSGKSYFSNNVGIGTTTAGSLLSIGGVANFAAAGSTLYSPFAFTSGVTMRGDLTVEGQTTLGNASTTNISASYASSTEAFFGSLSVGNLTGVLKATAGAVTASALDLVSDVTGILGISNGGTGTSTAPTYGQVLLGNALGGYDLVSTSSLGIQGGGGGTWGSITGTLADQTDLQNALNAKLSLTDWYATTTQDLAEGGTNLYYQDSRVQTYLDTIGKGYYFSTTSAQHFAAIGLAFSTTSSDFWRTARNFFSTTSAEFFVQSSSTIPKTYTNNTFTGANQFVGSTQAGALVANALSASTFGVGTVSTSTIQGGAVGTSTLQGFLNVLGTNSTSTFSAGLAANRLNITGVNATSTASGGFNITDGCYAIDGICIGGAGGGVTSVSNVDGTLTISPTTGAVVASLNLSNANIWTGLQRFGNASSTAFSALDYMAIGRTATTTIQGSTSGTSTLQGFINVLGTNSTSTFSGGLAANRINVTGSGTSTFAGGINVTSGCVAVNGTCLGTGSGGDAGFGVEAVEVFTTPGANSWIKPSYVNSVFVEVWGGGGGGGTAGANASDGGGGGGAYSAGIVTVDGNETATVGAVGTSNGGAGGTSSFTTNGTTVTATGGTGTTGLTGGAGGTASNGTINLSGQKGGNGLAADGGRSGDGGGSPRGGDGGKGKGGGNAAGGTGLAGENGLMPGGGGGGGAESNGVGGAGAQGMIVVWELSGTNGSDLAEMYATEPGVGPGDVVAIGSESIEYDSEWGLQEITVLKKADGNGKAVGVVATAPAVVMGRTINTDNSENPQPIALAGRTPVKIASSSAIIKEGDLIALSSQPGYAQKTEKAGEILGWALEDYDPASASGTVMIFVHTGYSSGARTKAILENAGIDTDTIPAHTDIGRMLLAQAISKKQDITASTTLSEVLTDRLYAGLEVIAPRVLTDTLVTNVIEPVDKNVDLRLLEDGVFTISRVGRDMMSVSFGAAASTSSSTLAVSIDAIGNALFAGTLTAANFEIGSKDKPGGLTMYDTASGEPYCTRITGGTLQTVPGKCNEGVNLDALATQAPEPPSSDAPSSGTTELGVDGSPSIVLNGKNPARVDVGDEYVDLGVMVSDDKDTNLAVTLFVDGSEVDAIQIDTSVSKEYVITYQVTDSDSHVTQKDRTVIVEAPSETAAAEESGEAVAPTAAPADEPAVEVQPEPSTQPADASHDTENSANNPASEPESAPAQSESEPLATTAPVTETEPIE